MPPRGYLCITVLAVALADIAIKQIVKILLPLGTSHVIVPGYFQLTHVQNTGAAFSLLNQSPVLLTLLASVLLLVFLGFAWQQPLQNKAILLSFSAVLGGATGNLFERLTQGAVTDYLDVVWIHYPIFNFADTCVVLGMLTLLVTYARQPHHASCS